MNSMNSNWWNSDEHYELVFGEAKRILNDQADILERNILYTRMYSNQEITGLSPLDYRSKTLGMFEDEGRIKLNVVSSVCDTINSKMAKSRPTIKLLPNDELFSIKSRAKQLEKFIAGVFDESKVYEEGSTAFMDSLLFGTGVLKVFEDEGNVAIERILPTELIVDDVEGFYGKPRQLHQKKEISRDVLHGMFPSKKGIIETATTVNLDRHSVSSVSRTNNTVTVVESWHLGSGDKPGKHTITCDQGDLFVEDYDKDDFPFVFLRWSKAPVGFFGLGVVSDIVGIQIEINKLLMKIQKAFHMLSNTMVFVNSSSVISKQHLSNKIATIIPYTGQPPIISAAQTVNPEVFQHLWQLYNKAFEIAGVSQMSATSKKPEGLDSGTALREFNDIESERFALAGQNYEALFIGVARKVVEIAGDIYEGNGDLVVQVKGKDFIESIDWKDVSLDNNQFGIIIAASSSLPTTKAGRTQIATEWFKAGIIDAEEWRELLDMPDLESDISLARAPKDYIMQIVELILSKGEYIAPEPMDNLGFAYSYSVMSYQRAKLKGVDEEILALLLDFIADVEALQEQAMEQAQAKQLEQQAQQMQLQQAMQPPAPQGPAPAGPKPVVPQNPIG